MLCVESEQIAVVCDCVHAITFPFTGVCLSVSLALSKNYTRVETPHYKHVPKDSLAPLVMKTPVEEKTLISSVEEERQWDL